MADDGRPRPTGAPPRGAAPGRPRPARLAPRPGIPPPGSRRLVARVEQTPSSRTTRRARADWLDAVRPQRARPVADLGRLDRRRRTAQLDRPRASHRGARLRAV